MAARAQSGVLIGESIALHAGLGVCKVFLGYHRGLAALLVVALLNASYHACFSFVLFVFRFVSVL